MITEKSTIKTEAIFSDDRQRRYLLHKEWDSKLPQATIIMTNPSTADILITDYTTLYIINNLVKLRKFGSVDIVNLTSTPTVKLKVKDNITENLEEENVAQIVKSCSKSDSIIIAWGKLGGANKTIRALQDKLLEHLTPYADKLCQICDDNGEFQFHPLAPSVRFVWHLIKFEISDKKGGKPEAEKQKTDQEKHLPESAETA